VIILAAGCSFMSYVEAVQHLVIQNNPEEQNSLAFELLRIRYARQLIYFLILIGLLVQ